MSKTLKITIITILAIFLLIISGATVNPAATVQKTVNPETESEYVTVTVNTTEKENESQKYYENYVNVNLEPGLKFASLSIYYRDGGSSRSETLYSGGLKGNEWGKTYITNGENTVFYVTVNCEKLPYTIKFNPNIENVFEITDAPTNVYLGDEPIYTFNLNEGYKIVSVENGTLGENTITLPKITGNPGTPINVNVNIEQKKFDLTVTKSEGVDYTISQSAVGINYGETVNISVKALPGYKLVSATINEEEKKLSELEDNLEITITDNTSVELKAVKEEYTVLEGENLVFDGKNKSDLIIRFSGPADLFRKLFINDKLVDEKNYTVESGSTIIALKSDYLATLEDGEYTVKAEYENGNIAETTFNVINNNEKLLEEANAETPKTGDIAIIPIIILAISALGIVITFIKRK